VSCKGTHILEKAVQVARHRRWIELRSTIEGGEFLQGKSGKSGVARFVRYRDCIGTLLPRSERTPLHAARQARHEADAQPPTSYLTRHTSASPPV
jgi:hypothetical protein